MSNHVKDHARPAFVYAVADPAGVRYVGCSVHPVQRFTTHRNGGDGTRSRFIKDRSTMRFLILEATTHEERDARERFWIAALARNGHPIENINHNPLFPKGCPKPSLDDDGFLTTEIGASIGLGVLAIGGAIWAQTMGVLAQASVPAALAFSLLGVAFGIIVIFALRNLGKRMVPLRWSGLRSWVTFHWRSVVSVTELECWDCRVETEYTKKDARFCPRCRQYYILFQEWESGDNLKSLIATHVRHKDRPWRKGFSFQAEIAAPRLARLQEQGYGGPILVPINPK